MQQLILVHCIKEYRTKSGGYKIKIDDLRKEPAVLKWFKRINPKPHTETNYLLSIKIFCEWLNKTPTEIIAEADYEAVNIPLMKNRGIEDRLLDFKAFLRSKDLSPKSISSYFGAILSFYKHHHVDIPALPREGRVEPLKVNRHFLKKDEIAEALNVCDVFERAIMLTELSSGLSAEEVSELKIKQFKEGYDPSTEITTLDLRRGKTGVDFITFLSPEASRAIWDYLKFRNTKLKNRGRKREKQLEKQNIVSDDGYLFILQRVPNEFLITGNEELRKIKTKVVVNLYRIISEKAHKDSPEKSWNIIRSHNMRKFFNSTLKNAGADHDFVEFCMGHRLSGTKMAYYEGDPVKLRDIYARFIPYLTIQKDLDISETPDYKRLTEELEKVKSDNEKLNTQLLSIELEQIREMEKRFEKLSPEEQEEIRKQMKHHKTLMEIAEDFKERKQKS